MAAKGEGSARMMTFVTQEEAEEIKKKRQEEWEKVRKPGDPEEAPAEVYDPRPLYERLKEERDRTQEQYEEQFKFKNMIYKGLDEEEASFLNVVVDQHTVQTRLMLNREREELNAYRDAVSRLQDEHEQQRAASTLVQHQQTEQIASPKPQPKISKSQLSILAGSIITKRKRTSSSSSSDTPKPDNKEKRVKPEDERSFQDVSSSETTSTTGNSSGTAGTGGAGSTSSGGGLAGLAAYSSSSSEEEDTDNENKNKR